MWRPFIISTACILGLALPAAAEVRNITFPVIGPASYGDDFGAPRSGGRTHEGTDIFGAKGQALVAAVSGRVSFVPCPEPSYGYYLSIRDTDGYRYNYLHINNDTPGTDDGNGHCMDAYAPGMEPGARVNAGQLVGYLGDSGNAEGTAPHLHFEIRRPDGEPINPFDSLNAAPRIGASVPGPALPGELLPFGEFRGPVVIDVGNFDADEDEELVVGAGVGGGPQVVVMEQDGEVISTFFAYDPAFRGGIDVAAADTDKDGIDEIVTGAGVGGGPHVRVFQTDGKIVNQFFAFDPGYRGGIRVVAADLNANGRDEIIVGLGPGTIPDVRIFRSHDGKLVRTFLAYDVLFRGGIDVTAWDATESRPARIVTGAGPGGGPHVRPFDKFGTPLSAGFLAYDAAFRGGVRVSAGDFDPETNRMEVVTAPASGGSPDVRVFRWKKGIILNYLSTYEDWWLGGWDIAVGERDAWLATGGNRRAGVREATD